MTIIQLESITSTVHALAHQKRLIILELLNQSKFPLTVNQIKQEVNFQNVSTHLKCLRDNNLVVVRPKAQLRLYSIEKTKYRSFLKTLHPVLKSINAFNT